MSLNSCPLWLQPMRAPLHSPLALFDCPSPVPPSLFILLLISSFLFFLLLFLSIVFPSLHLPALFPAVYPLIPPDSLLPPSLSPSLIYPQRTCLPPLSLPLGLPRMLSCLLLNPRSCSSLWQFIIMSLHLHRGRVLTRAIASTGVYLMIRQGMLE